MGISQDPGDIQILKGLLARARQGDGEAFCQLAGPLQERLFRQALSLCHSDSIAEDLVAETMVEAWKSLARYNETCRFTTWLYSILLHRYHKNVRRMQSRPIAVGELPETEIAPEPSPAEDLMAVEKSREVWALVDTLDVKHREVILLRFVEDASLLEMAAALRCSEGTIKSRLHHALKKLRKMKFV